MGDHKVSEPPSEPPCHETTARAARREREILVTLIRLASNARVFLEYRLGIPEDFATPLR